MTIIRGSRTDPWGTPAVTGNGWRLTFSELNELIPFTFGGLDL